MNTSDKDILAKFIPLNSVDAIFDLLKVYPLQFTITNPRKRIHGSYRRPRNRVDLHKITVNGDLNKYTFLLTLLHEIAHMHAWVFYKSLGHGNDWKNCFLQLIKQFLNLNVFPEDIRIALENHLQNIKSSDCLDIYLTKTLQKYDRNSPDCQKILRLEEIPENTVFLHDGKQMKKQKLLRKYYLCKELKTNKMYRCHPLMEVEIMNS